MNFIEIRFSSIKNEIENFLKAEYNKASILFSSASPYGQILGVLENLHQLSFLYLKNSIIGLDVNQPGITERMIKNAAIFAGHIPGRAISASGTLRFSLKTDIDLEKEVAGGKISFFNKLPGYIGYSNRTINDTIIIKDITKISKKTFSEKLRIIKEYIIDLVNEKKLIELKGSTKTFFDNYFPCIWDDTNTTSYRIIETMRRRHDIENFKLYKLIKNNTGSFEIKEVEETYEYYFLYRPVIVFGLVNYKFSTSESLKIFNSLSPDLITKFDVKDSDNIVRDKS